MARRSEHSKEEITAMALAAAKALIEAEGLAGLSARKIAAQIGYTVGSLYMVFENLDDLILHANAVTLDELYQQLKVSTDGNQAQTKLTSLAHTYIDYAMANRNCWNAVFEHHLPEGRKTPEWYQRRVDRIFALVEQSISQLKADRQQAAKSARALWCGVHGICVLYMTNKLHLPETLRVQSLVDDLVSNYLAGWLRENEQ